LLKKNRRVARRSRRSVFDCNTHGQQGRQRQKAETHHNQGRAAGCCGTNPHQPSGGASARGEEREWEQWHRPQQSPSTRGRIGDWGKNVTNPPPAER
jgi:hypothetical protein